MSKRKLCSELEPLYECYMLVLVTIAGLQVVKMLATMGSEHSGQRKARITAKASNHRNTLSERKIVFKWDQV